MVTLVKDRYSVVPTGFEYHAKLDGFRQWKFARRPSPLSDHW